MRDIFKLVIDGLIERQEKSTEQVIKEFRKIVPSQDWGLFQILFFGVLDWQSHLVTILGSFSSMRISKFGKRNLYLLLVAIYGILYLDKPNHAIVNEAVELMKTQNKRLVSMTNGILRNIIREKDLDKRVYGKMTLRQVLIKKYDYPVETIELFLEELGQEETIKLLEASKAIPRLDFLVLGSEEECLELLEEEGHEFEKLGLERAYTMLKNNKPLERIRAYKRGRIYYQSLNSQRVASFVPEGDNFLDLCGAPGGKSFALLARDPNRQVTICDLTQSKLDIVEENAQRLSLKMDIRRWDASDFNQEWERAFSSVLVDAPCSGTGVLHRQRGESRLKKLDDLDELIELQEKILNQAARYVDNHGFLIYSTCSILRGENEDQVEKFLSKHPDFSIVRSGAFAGDYFRTMPWDGEDGFFACVMERSL
ncbi:MAG: hypothetical protein GX079_00180 [Tissierellia bacterium]|nr:hypothetical protein [Tissierellia bacterium]